jgi:hypothetical protein
MKRTLLMLPCALLIAIVVCFRVPTAQTARTHITTGSSLPANCTVGDIFYKTGTSAGQYTCSATDTWTGPLGSGGGSGTVTTSGSPASGNLSKFSGSTAITNGDLSGDVTTSGTLTTTLATSGVSAATYGDSTHVAQVAVDAKGRITTASNVAIAANTSTTAVGSEPGSPVAGDVDLYTNGFGVARYSGSAWVPWGPLFALTDPALQTFAWINQGGASIVTTNGGVALVAPQTAGNNLRIRKKAAPSTPYTITAAFLPSRPNINFLAMGLVFRDSASSKLATFGYIFDSTGSSSQVGASKFTNETTFSANYSPVMGWTPASLLWLRITDNGTNRISSVSNDGQNWIQVHSVGRTDFLTANEVGFYIDTNNATFGAVLTLLSWKET